MLLLVGFDSERETSAKGLKFLQYNTYHIKDVLYTGY